MGVHFRQVTIHFDPTKGRKQRETGTAHFPARVLRADAAIKGFNLGYTDKDHHVFRQEVDVDVTKIAHRAVEVAVDFLLRDSSGRIDDRFDGWTQVLVIAVTE